MRWIRLLGLSLQRSRTFYYLDCRADDPRPLSINICIYMYFLEFLRGCVCPPCRNGLKVSARWKEREFITVHIYPFHFFMVSVLSSLVHLDQNLIGLAANLVQRPEARKTERHVEVGKDGAEDLLDTLLTRNDAAVEPWAAHCFQLIRA